MNVATGEEEPQPKGSTAGMVALSVVLAVGLFMVTPFLIGSLAGWLGAPLLLRELVDGLASIGIFVGYCPTRSACSATTAPSTRP
jgi:hypothetical protein